MGTTTTEIIKFKPVDWLPSKNKSDIERYLPTLYPQISSIGRDASGLIINVIITFGDIVLAYCSPFHELPDAPDGYKFIKETVE